MISAMTGGQLESEFGKQRRRMVDFDLRGRDITDPDVLAVMGDVPREKFISSDQTGQAYADGPLPIGQAQTISQPYIVALMTQHLRLDKNCDVLEIGTGSGYQTAVLSRLAGRIFTIERFAELSDSARVVLGGLGFDNIEYRVGDGSCGWPEKRTFDRIMVTALVPKIPQPLTEQLADGGLLVAPVESGGIQELVLGRKSSDKLQEMTICGCRFVKLVGKYGFGQG